MTALAKILADSERTRLEDTLASQLRAAGIPYERQVRAVPARRFRYDFAVGDAGNLLVEVDGATWTGGRHTRGAGYASGCEKQALATIAGFPTLRVTGEQVTSGQALAWIEEALLAAKARHML